MPARPGSTRNQNEAAMRHQFTSGQVRMLIQRAENQFALSISQSLAADPAGKHVARAAHAQVHETVVSVIKLFRDQIPGAAEVATRLARMYAKGADANAGVPTLDCLRAIMELTRQARERYLPAVTPAADGAEAEPARR
jgi:hypothetical protein